MQIRVDTVVFEYDSNGIGQVPLRVMDYLTECYKPSFLWIPCSERLPGKDGNYLIAYEDACGLDVTIGTYRDNPRGIESPWTACDAYGLYHLSDRYQRVIAWMEFPEPYEA